MAWNNFTFHSTTLLVATHSFGTVNLIHSNSSIKLRNPNKKMPTVSSDLLVADNLGRAMAGQFETSTTTTTMSPMVSISSFVTTTKAPDLGELMMANGQLHNQLLASSEDVTAIQSPLLATGLENSSALIHAMLAAFSVILVSELGDKTFIITAIMAMKNSRSLVFIASASALLLMTILSVGMGVAVTVIPEVYTHYASIALFICFGLKMLKEAYDLGADDEKGESEFEEVERSLEEEDSKSDREIKTPKPLVVERSSEEVAQKLDNNSQTDQSQPCDSEQILPVKAEQTRTSSFWNKLIENLYVAPIVIKVFTMIFVAEWGDRSQISTVILAAREDVVGVFVGSLSGHVLCTGLAVVGGRVVAEIISIRTLTFLGGIIFLFFATVEIISGP